MKNKLLNITLIGIDCIDIERLKLAADICQKDFEFGAVKLLTSIPDNDMRIVSIDNIDSIEKYSDFCLQKMNDYVDTDFVLIIQYDGFILNPNAWTDEFLQYDYIGAPWWYEDEYNVGNGGFCLRSKRLLNLLQNDPCLIRTEHAEDHEICRIHGEYLKSKGINFAPESVACRFSIEGDDKLPVKYGSTWTNEFGFHDLKRTKITKWAEDHPEYARNF